MHLFQVLLRPGASSDPLSDSGATFVADNFSWFAALVPPLWAIVHGLWLELIIWIGAMVALGAVDLVMGSEASFWFYVLSAVWIGYEASAIRVSALKRKQFHLAGDLIASDEIFAEMEWMKREAVA